jgi:hypothetical protein
MMFDPHVIMLAAVSLGTGWLMMKAGLAKSALEFRRRRRICPSCGRTIETRVCSICS